MRAEETGAARHQDGLAVGNGLHGSVLRLGPHGRDQFALQGLGAVGGGVLGEEATSGRLAHGLDGGRRARQRIDDCVARFRQDDFFSRREQGFEPRPGVRNDRTPARSRLEQSDGGAVSRRPHVGAGDVQGEAAGGVEGRMLGRRQMVDPFHVRRPGDIIRILRPRHDEAPAGQPSSRLEQQPFQRGLTIHAIGSEIGQIPTLLGLLRPVRRRVGRAIEGARRRRIQLLLQTRQRGTACEGEIDVVVGDLPRREIVTLALRQPRQGDRRIDVIEGDHALGRAPDPSADLDPVRHIRADHDRVGAAHRLAVAVEVPQVRIEGEAAVVGV